MSDTELYNKYRPSEFEELVGQDHVTKVIESYIKAGNLPQGLVFFGSHGTGKTTMARIIAKKLNSHYSGLIEVNSAAEGGVSDMRKLEQSTFNYPSGGEHKTYIIDEAHRVSSAGFDSLLKAVEEPPPGVTFIFVTTNVDQIPSTIRSRCDLHTFYRISSKLVEERLKFILKSEKVKLTGELISLAVEAGAGSLRDSIVALNKIITMYSDNQSQIDIVRSLGIVGPKGLTEFCIAYLTNNHTRLHQAAGCFNPDIVDSVKAAHALQRFTLDARAAIIDQNMILKVETNVELFLENVRSELGSAFGSSLPVDNYAGYIDQCLLYIYDMSLLLEEDLRKTSNHKSLLDRFVIKLVKSRA